MINIKTDFKTRIVEMINEDQELKNKWNELSESAKKMLKSIDAGERTPNLLRDIMFKSVFNPEIHPDWLSKLVGAILGKDVHIIRMLPVEGIYISEFSKGVLFDMMVEFESGEIAIVEVQKRGNEMPSERPVVYSANAVVRQHSILKGQKKGDVDYSDIHPVYTIVLMEESTEKFKAFKAFHHHFEQKSDTGLDLELIQYYDYICLDVFRENKPHTTEKLIQWIDFLSITDTTEMEPFLIEHPDFVEIYARACEMLADKEGLLEMLAELSYEEDIVGIINATNEGRAKKYEAKIRKMDAQIREMDTQLKEKDMQLEEKDARIHDLEAQLTQSSKE